MRAYPPIPTTATLFQSSRGYGYEEPTTIHEWVWRPDFGSWGALVTFADGWHGVTAPRPYNNPPQLGPSLHWTCYECDHDFTAHETDNFLGNGPRCPMCSSGRLDPVTRIASHYDPAHDTY